MQIRETDPRQIPTSGSLSQLGGEAGAGMAPSATAVVTSALGTRAEMQAMMETEFTRVASSLSTLHKRMEQLIQENDRLRRELAALRAGANVVVEIEGRRFALTPENG
jgi:cell division protein FtsB